MAQTPKAVEAGARFDWSNPKVSGPILIGHLHRLKAALHPGSDVPIACAMEMVALGNSTPSVTVHAGKDSAIDQIYTGACAPLIANAAELLRWRAERQGTLRVTGQPARTWATALEGVAALWSEVQGSEMFGVVQRAVQAVEMIIGPTDIFERSSLTPTYASHVAFFGGAAINLKLHGMSEENIAIVQKIRDQQTWKDAVHGLRVCRDSLVAHWRQVLAINLNELEAELNIELAALGDRQEVVSDSVPRPALSSISKTDITVNDLIGRLKEIAILAREARGGMDAKRVIAAVKLYERVQVETYSAPGYERLCEYLMLRHRLLMTSDSATVILQDLQRAGVRLFVAQSMTLTQAADALCIDSPPPAVTVPKNGEEAQTKTVTPALQPKKAGGDLPTQRPDGPDGDCWVWWKGKRHDVPKGIVFRLIKHFWDRDSSRYDDLSATVYIDSPPSPGQIRTDCSAAGKALKDIGAGWRLGTNSTDRIITKKIGEKPKKPRRKRLSKNK